MIDLQAIKARYEAATELPWEVKTSPDITIPGVFGGNSYSYSGYYNPPELADAEFIAHAREDIPDLLEELNRLWGDDGAPHESGDKCISCERWATEGAWPYCDQCLLEAQLALANETIVLLEERLEKEVLAGKARIR